MRQSFSRVIVLAAFLAVPLSAQVTIQSGATLSQMISNLYGGNGIQLKPNGHEAHFGQTEDFQQFSETLEKTLQSRPVFPVPSSVGVVSFKFNDETGTYEKIEGSFGPLLSERATTSGRGHANFSTSVSVSDFDRFNGNDTIPLTLRHCLTDACTGGKDAPYLHDVIKVNVRMKLRSQVLATSIIYGLTDRIDVGMVIPYIRNDMNVFTHASVVPAPGSNPLTHQFDPTIQTSDQLAIGHAIGIGDIILRGKVQVHRKLPFDIGFLTDVTLPSGQKENFLGTGDLRIKETVIVSKSAARVSPHFNLGYELNTNTAKLNAIDWRAGSELLVTPRLTIAGDLLGTVQPSASSEFQVRALEGQSLIGRSQIDGSIGGKWQVNGRTLLTFNLLAPLNSAGIRPHAVISGGVQFGM